MPELSGKEMDHSSIKQNRNLIDLLERLSDNHVLQKLKSDVIIQGRIRVGDTRWKYDLNCYSSGDCISSKSVSCIN